MKTKSPHTKPLSEKQILDIVKAGATVTAEQYIAGLETGLDGMLRAGLVFHAEYLDRLPKATIRRLGFKV